MSNDASYYDALAVSEQFFELYDEMLGEVDIPKVLRGVADVVCRDIHSQRATVYLVRPDTQELESVALIGNVDRVIRIPISETSLAGFCAKSGQSFLVPDAYDDLSSIDPKLKFDRSWDEVNNFRTKDVMCAPAVFKGEVLGVVQAINSRAESFSDRDLESLKGVSRLVGYSLYHARLYDDLVSMKQLEKEKAQFARVMVHELKSPVAASKMLIDVLKMQNKDNPKVSDIVGKVANRMDQLIALIQDLLEFAKIRSGEPMGEVEVLDIVEQTKNISQQYVEQARQKGLEINIALDSEPLNVRIDSKGYQMVVSNLLSNAVKYTAEGLVELGLSKEDSHAVLVVKDSGIGIPKKDIPRMFNEFFRASNAKQNRIPGSGVGLSGVKAIVERFGGQMEMDSEENVGSTFSVRLPLYKE